MPGKHHKSALNPPGNRTDNPAKATKEMDQSDRKGNQRKGKPIDTKTVKLFISITVLFVLSFLPPILQLLETVNQFYIMYAYFINHFGNPVIYFIIDSNFREEFRQEVKIIKCWK